MKDYNQHIEDYLLGNQSEVDKKLFEEAMANDANLAQNVANQRSLIDALKQHQLRNKIKSNFEKIKDENKTEPIAFNWKRAAVYVGVVSTIGLAGYWAWNKSAEQEIAKVNSKNVTDSIATINQPKLKDNIFPEQEVKPEQTINQLADVGPSPKSNETEPQSYLRGLKKNEKNYGALLADQFFEMPPHMNYSNPNDSIIFRQGIIYLVGKKYEEASSTFLKIDETSTAYPYSQWYFALSLLARERYDSLMPLLQDMADDQNFIYQHKAAKLLEKVKLSN